MQTRTFQILDTVYPYIGSDTTEDPEGLIEDICKRYGVSIDEIRSKTRKREVVEMRHLIHWILYRLKLCGAYTDYTVEKIGLRTLRHHATVLHSFNTINDWILYYPKIRTRARYITGMANNLLGMRNGGYRLPWE